MSYITARLCVIFPDNIPLIDKIGEAKEKAADLNMAYINFNHKGTSFSISRLADIESVIDEFSTSPLYITS